MTGGASTSTRRSEAVRAPAVGEAALTRDHRAHVRHPEGTGSPRARPAPDAGRPSMTVRELTDTRGVGWRVWDVTPDSVRPRAGGADYLAGRYAAGWLVFERLDESEKRRLPAIPPAWHELPASELAALLDRAELVPPRRRQTGEHARPAEDPTVTPAAVPLRADLADLDVMRTFHYPGGRIWTVCVCRPRLGGQPVLRFTAGLRKIDLREWPAEWADLADEQLVELLRRAAPREEDWTEGAPRRRHGDPRDPRDPRDRSRPAEGDIPRRP